MTKLPKLPAPMTAKFVYPDMIELNLSTGVLEFWGHPCCSPPIYPPSEPRTSTSF